jgi:hypothetical protein
MFVTVEFWPANNALAATMAVFLSCWGRSVLANMSFWLLYCKAVPVVQASLPSFDVFSRTLDATITGSEN